MTKKTKKAKAPKKEKIVKVQIEEPIAKASPETFKVEPKVEKQTEIPKAPVIKPKIDPNNPRLERISEGFKRPSITDLRPAHTKKQFQAVIDAYKIQNPVKYEQKRVALEAQLKALR